MTYEAMETWANKNLGTIELEDDGIEFEYELDVDDFLESLDDDEIEEAETEADCKRLRDYYATSDNVVERAYEWFEAYLDAQWCSAHDVD